MFGDFLGNIGSFIGDLFGGASDTLGDIYGSVSDAGSGLFDSLGGLVDDAGDFLGQAGRIGKDVSNTLDPISRILQMGQARQPRLDRSGFGDDAGDPSALAFSRTYDPNMIRTMGRDMQAKGIAPSAVTSDFYRAYLPPEYQNLDTELLMRALQYGRF